MKNEILKNAGLLYEEKKPFPKSKPTKKDMTPYQNLGKKDLDELVSIASIYGDYNDIIADEIIKRDTDGSYIFKLGRKTSEINATKLLKAYGERDVSAIDIKNAEESWSSFDYDLGSDLVIEKAIEDNTGSDIFLSGLRWKKFNYKKGIRALSKLSGKWHKMAKEQWPKSATEKLKQVEKQDEVKIPTKRKKL